MKVSLCGLLLLVTSVLSARLISQDEIDSLFKKFANNELNEHERATWDELVELLHRPEHLSRATDFSQSTARNTIDCIICQSAFSVLFDNVHAGHTDNQLTDTITTLCTSLGIQTYKVCHGAVGLNMPVLSHIIRTTPEATAGTFCGLVLQSATSQGVCAITDTRFEFQVELPDYTGASQNETNSSSDSLKIVVLTDAHIDPLYEANGVADCDEPTCCRKGQTPRTSFTNSFHIGDHILRKSIVMDEGNVLLDLETSESVRKARMATQTRVGPRTAAAAAGYWGDYRSCDTPLWAYDNVIQEIASKHKDADLIYYIGDTIDHGIWETSYELIKEMNAYVVDKIRLHFGDDVPVIPAIGNHESQPTNQFAPSSVIGPYINTTWLYDSLAEKWSHYLTEEAQASLRERGDFSLLVRPGLRVISINNNVAYRSNWWLVYDPQEQKGHLDWLVAELYRAELAGEKVHILAHIPPGVHDLTQVWTREFNRIVNRFSETITAEFNGHTHADELKVYYNAAGAAVGVAWGAGGATSYANYNLNYKVVSATTDTYEISNIQNYIYNLTEANLTPNRDPHWFELYDMRHRFRLTDLSAASIDDMITRMVTSEKELLDLYAAFFSKLSDTRWPYCNNDCKINELCKAVVTVLWERQKCNEIRELYYNN